MSLTLLFALYPSTPHPKLPLVSHLLTFPASKIVDINWSLPKDGCETSTSDWWWWLGVWPSQTNQKPFINIASIEKDNHWYENHHSFASALLISTPFDLDRKKRNFELQKMLQMFQIFRASGSPKIDISWSNDLPITLLHLPLPEIIQPLTYSLSTIPYHQPELLHSLLANPAIMKKNPGSGAASPA